MADYIGSFSGSFTGSYDILTNTEEYDGTTYGYVLHQRAGIGKAENILLSDFFRDWLGSESGSAGIQDYGAAGYINDSDRILIRSQSFDGSTTRPILKTATLSNLFGGYSTNASLRNTFVYARGVGRNTEPTTSNSSSMVLTMGGAVVYDNNVGGGELHGLTLTILEATDFSTVSTTRYNTAHGGTTSAANSLATAIDDMSPTEVGVITSLGHWETYVTSTLRTAAKKVGLSKLGGYVSSDSGSAYASVFYGTSGSAGVGDVIERLVAYRFTTGSDLDIPTATITTRLQSNVHGVYPFVNISDASSTNALYRFSADTSSVLEPALLVNSDGNINAAGDVITFKSDTATITMDMSSDSARLFVDGYVSTSGHIVPSTTELYDLGSTDLRWRDLYLSGSTSTIYLGTSQLSSDGTNTSGSFTGSFSGEGTNIVGIVSSSYADSSSYANSSSYADSSSYAVTASYAINGGSGGGGGTPGGSTTQIQYNNAGAFGGASGFVWDSINGRVGLGTGSPSEKLDVVGNTSIGGRLKLDYGGTVMTRMTNTGNTDLSWDTRIADTSGVYEIRSVQDNGTSVKTPLSIAHATGYATFNERVGIGTTSPDALLHISAGNSGDAKLIIEADEDNNDENDVPQIWFKADGDITEGLIGLNNNYLDFVSNVSSGGFRFFTGTTSNSGATDPYTAATEKVRIASDGNVGIGTTDPQATLHVSNGGTTKVIFANSDFASGTVGSGILLSTGATSGNTYSSIYAFQAGNTSYNNLVVPGGNVGIGTTSPGELLHLSNSGDANIRLENSGNGNTSAIEFWRQRASGTGARGASIWIESDTGTNNTDLYIDTSTLAGAPGSTTLGTNNGRIVVRGSGTPSISMYSGTNGGELKFSTRGLELREAASTRGIANFKENSVEHTHILSPGGGHYSTTTATVTGAIQITLPTICTATSATTDRVMLTMWVDIMEYTSNESISLFLGGYTYLDDGSYDGWANTTATIVTARSDKEFNVRFGNDGTNHQIWIGELADEWSHPQIRVRDVNVGFSVYATGRTVEDMTDGWDVDFATSFGTVDASETKVASLTATSAATWTTSRTLTIGDTGKSVNGGSNVTWSRTELGITKTNIDALGINADLLDGQQGSYYAIRDHIRSLGITSFTNGSNPNITTAQLVSEMESDGAFDSYTSVFKTSWSYAGNYNLTDAGRFTETAGTSWITWTDNSSDSTRGNITALAIAPNTGGSAGRVFIYNDQGSGYFPGWREVWTSTSDGAGSGLDADLWDGNQFATYLNQAVLTTSSPTFANVTATTEYRTNTNSAGRVKYNVYGSGGTYGIGMQSGRTHGGLGDWAMTFQMNNDDDRGWLWCDSTNTGASSGAMSLTTNGKSSLAHSMMIGYGETNTTTPGATYRLDVSGTIRATTDVVVTSDIRLKNELSDTVQGLETVDKLRPIKYTLKDDEDENPKIHLGFSAQELLDIVPEVVSEDDEGMYSVAYQKLVPVLVKAIQELTEEVRELKKKVEE